MTNMNASGQAINAESGATGGLQVAHLLTISDDHSPIDIITTNIIYYYYYYYYYNNNNTNNLNTIELAMCVCVYHMC